MSFEQVMQMLERDVPRRRGDALGSGKQVRGLSHGFLRTIHSKGKVDIKEIFMLMQFIQANGLELLTPVLAAERNLAT